MSLEALDPVPSPARVLRRSARWGRSLATLAALAGLALIASALFAASEVARPTAGVVLDTPSTLAANSASPRAAVEADEAESEAIDDDGPSYDWGDDFGQVGEGALLARSPRSGHFASLPLEHTDVHIDVRGLVATATVTQRFRNPGARPIEAVYVFPLPADAAVYDMEARVGTRLIKSAVKERQQARAVYEQAKASGQRAALLEQERPNIFTTALANVLPGERVDVRLRYVNVLPWEGGRARLTFPLVVGPRYIPGASVSHDDGASDAEPVPDAARITPPTRTPGTRSGHDVTLHVLLDTGLALERVESPSHPIVSQATEAGLWTVTLRAGSTLPNRDFVIELVPASERAPRAALFVSPAQRSEDDAHFLLATYPPTLSADDRAPLEWIFVIDVSGSMAGTSIQQARAALQQGLERLTPRDRFQIVAYSDDYRMFRSQPAPANALNVAAAKLWIHTLRAGGGTELLPALQAVLTLPANPGFLRQIVLLTDGCLGNEDQLLASLRGGLGDARLYTVAIGSAPNHHLAAKLAEYGRGTFKAITDGSEVQTQMGRLLDQISNPVLTDLHLTWQGLDVQDVLPRRLPDLYQGQPLLLYGRLASGAAAGTLVLEGRAQQQVFRRELVIDPARARYQAGIPTLWARARVEELMDRWRDASEGAPRDEARRAIVDLALRQRLVTRFTALVAVEERPAHDQGTPEAVAVATELPAGWQLGQANLATGNADLFLEALALGLLAAGVLLLAVHKFTGATA